MCKYENIKLDNQLCFSLYAASREVIKLYKPCLDKFNITYTQYIALLVLWEKDKITVKEIGEKLHLDSGTLTPLLKKIESRGFIRRYRSKEDDRVVIVELTKDGMDLKEKIVCIPRQMECKINLTKSEILELKEKLDYLLEKI